jgi:hypothetical protein
VFQIGTVRSAGSLTIIEGWGLGVCASQCSCHRSPSSQQLVIFQDEKLGLLGLVSFRTGCGCCVPWTAEELAAIVDELDELANMPTQETS